MDGADRNRSVVFVVYRSPQGPNLEWERKGEIPSFSHISLLLAWRTSQRPKNVASKTCGHFYRRNCFLTKAL